MGNHKNKTLHLHVETEGVNSKHEYFMKFEENTELAKCGLLFSQIHKSQLIRSSVEGKVRSMRCLWKHGSHLLCIGIEINQWSR